MSEQSQVQHTTSKVTKFIRDGGDGVKEVRMVGGVVEIDVEDLVSTLKPNEVDFLQVLCDLLDINTEDKKLPSESLKQIKALVEIITNSAEGKYQRM